MNSRPKRVQYFVFNFTFVTPERKYSLDTVTKKDRKFAQKFLQKIESLSVDTKVQVLGRNREQGFEFLPLHEVHVRIHPELVSYGITERFDGGYWIFRLAKLGRVICGMDGTVVYILAVDTEFRTYKH